MVDHPDRGPVAFTLRPRYRVSELATEWNMSKKLVLTMLADCGVHPRPGRDHRRGSPLYVWISDVSACAPHLLDSWAEVRHQRELAGLRERGQGSDPGRARRESS